MILNAGAYLQYLWDQRQELAAKTDIDIITLARTLSTFSLKEHRYTAPPHSSPLPTAQTVIATYIDILSRGIPTLSSLYVERKILEPIIQKSWATESTTSGSIRFNSTPSQAPANWLDLLAAAHVAVDPEISYNDFDTTVFDSSHEDIFFRQVLPQAYGPALAQFAAPQRSLQDLLGATDRASFQDQRVDFTIDLPDTRIVVEIDGNQHQSQSQQAADEARDAALSRNGWKVLRLETSTLQAKRPINRLRHRLIETPLIQAIVEQSSAPLSNTAEGRLALRTVLTSFAVARIQRTLLHALETSYLSLDASAWSIIVVERDLPCAALAVNDFMAHLRALLRLNPAASPPPRVTLTVYTATPNPSSTIHPSVAELRENGVTVQISRLTTRIADAPASADILIDTSMLQREGYSPISRSLPARLLSLPLIAYEIRSAYAAKDTRRLAAGSPTAYTITEEMRPTLRFFLQNIFRKHDFRPGQFEILRRSLALQPVIGLLPTGAGKSVCYQLSALLQPGMTIIVDPLISLIVDQMENLSKNWAIDWLDSINSLQGRDGRIAVEERLAAGTVKLIFISPERFQSREFRTKLQSVTVTHPVTYAVIDEAHCVSEWGHDFRTAYLRLADTISRYCRHGAYTPTIIALTGTASYAVLSDVQREINVDDEQAKVYPQSFDRPELRFRVIRIPSLQKESELKNLLDQRIPAEFGTHPRWFHTANGDTTSAGIVFTPHAGKLYGATTVSAKLSDHLGIPVHSFTGKTDNSQKSKIQTAFKANDFPLLVATKAFGMGIDKPNIRYTVHYNIPPSLESFYQEAGRAGRDQKPAVCWLLFSDDDPAKTDAALQPEADAATIAAAAADYKGGDVSRLLFLHRNSFRGFHEEWNEIKELYKGYIGPAIKTTRPGVETAVNVPFSDFTAERNKQDYRNRALYRLAILGLVRDYVLDYNHKHFEVTVIPQTDDQLIANLGNYVGRYKTHQVVTTIPRALKAQEGDTMLGKCAAYLLHFVYDEIEKKRRSAIRSVVEVARRASPMPLAQQDNYIRDELLAYLEESPFTGPLLAMAKEIRPDDWLRILALPDATGVPHLSMVDGARSLIGSCRRMLDGNPEHPGYYFLRSVARLLMPSPDIDLAYDDARLAFTYLAGLSQSQRDQASIDLIIRGYAPRIRALPDGTKILQDITELALDANPTRTTARGLARLSPQKADTLFLNFALADIRTLNQTLSPENS